MINNLESFLPEEFINNAYSLKHLGINEYAWDRNYILKVINYLWEKKTIILGGDVYTLSDGVLKAAYANWYFNVDLVDTMEHNVNHSVETAIKYINNYSDKYNSYYSLIIRRT